MAKQVGRLGLIDGASLLAFSTLTEVSGLQPEVADRYARMAEALAARYATYDSSKEGFAEDMADALHLTGEHLVVRLSGVARRIDALALKSESQGPHSYTRVEGKINELIHPLALGILDYFATTSPKHSSTFTKVFAAPQMTDDEVNVDRLSRAEEETDFPFIEFDENL